MADRSIDHPSVRPHAFVLAVHDLSGTAAYCIDRLGFAREWHEPDRWEGLMRGEMRLFIGRCPETLPAAELGDHSYFGFVATDDVDALHREFAARGALIRHAPADRPWGWREMAVATPEGHRMMFAQWIGSA